MKEILISQSVADKITEQCRAEYPSETCGLLLGRVAGDQTHVEQMYPVTNVASSDQKRHYYQMDPRGILNAQKYADQNRLEIVGVYHSHPDCAAEPSQTDRNMAWEGWSYVIAETRLTGEVRLRSWRLSGLGFAEELVRIE